MIEAKDYLSRLGPSCIRVGIVGHRPTHPLRSDLKMVLGDLFLRLEGLASPGTIFTLVSCLAEGVDLAAVAARPAGWRLEGVLPFVRANYALDFSPGIGKDALADHRAALASCDSVTEIAADRDDLTAYERAARLMLGTLDVLVAVWDAEPERGVGGTAGNVADAMEAAVPTLHVPSMTVQDNHAGGMRLILSNPSDGTVSTVCDNDGIDLQLKSLMNRDLPEETQTGRPHGGDKEPDVRERLLEFMDESDAPGVGWLWYRRMKRLLAGKALPASIDVLPPPTPAAPTLEGAITDGIERIRVRSDALAVYYSNTYRSAYIQLYAVSALAVLCAVLGFFIPHDWLPDWQVHAKVLLVLVELMLISLILWTVQRGKQERWHQKWIDYRALAERLRHACFLARLGAHRTLDGAPSREAPNWIDWLQWRLTGRIGLPDAVIDNAYLSAVLDRTRGEEVLPQITYHRRNAEELRRVAHKLHVGGTGFFFLTAIFLVIYLALYGLNLSSNLLFPAAAQVASQENTAGSGLLVQFLYAAKPYLGAVGAVFPAIGAALSGIRFTGEFEAFARRSEQMVRELEELAKRYQAIGRSPTLEGSTKLLLDTAETLHRDLQDWKSIYTLRRLDLPS